MEKVSPLASPLIAAGNAYTEQIRSLRSTLIQLARLGKSRLLVTSSWPKEGKTTMVFHLAHSLEELGISLLLVDFDVHSHGLSSRLGVDLNAGEDVPQGCSMNNTQLLRPGKSFHHGGLLTNSGRARLTGCWQPFDMVLVDAPSLSASREALAFGGLVDGALMVVSRRHFRGIIEGHHSEDLRDHGIELLGCVVSL